MHLPTTALMFVLLWTCVKGYNLDTSFPIIYNSTPGNYFGFTVALHRNREGSLVLVGAPREDSSSIPVSQSGALYKCTIPKNNTAPECQEVILDTEGNKRITNGDEFSYYDLQDGMWLGVSLDVQQSNANNDVVTCGHLWRNQYYRGHYLVNGVCYVINSDLDHSSVVKLLPLIQRSKQAIIPPGIYYFAHGQAGASVAFSKDGKYLLIGATGVYDWTGSVVSYSSDRSNPSTLYKSPITPDPPDSLDDNSNLGYSVTSGRFFHSNKLYIAAGAPRGNLNLGEVCIFQVVRKDSSSLNVRETKRGTQLGEYYGASVLAVNLNDDLYTDLVVGAPLNSLGSAGDEGKVYVYISDGQSLQKQIQLTGDEKAGARFGTSLANIGDLNQDGYNDIAIGAPYEDGRGAVYIYFGSSSGVQPEYSQKISAADISLQLSGFGIYISHGLDIDDNGYPDIAVGSYNSSNAVLFRSRPVIHIFSEIIATPQQIAMDVDDSLCEIGGENLTCVQVDACLRYDGKHVPESLNFEFTMSIQDERGFFARNKHRTFTSRQTVVLDVNVETCLAFKMHLRPDIKDILTPIPVEFSHRLQLPKELRQTWYKTFPVYNPSNSSSITSEIPFMTDCGQSSECVSDLSVSARRIEPPDFELITLGSVSSISVVITVKNSGESAYTSQLLIFLPSEMPSINHGDCEQGSLQNKTSLVCELENPLRTEAQVEIRIKLDTTKIPPLTKYLEIAFRAITISTEIYPVDNNGTLPFHLKTVSDIHITGYSIHDQIMYDETQSASPIIRHTFIVTNHGPSPLQTIDIVLNIPHAFFTSAGKEPFLSFTRLETDSGMRMTIPAVCNDTSLDFKHIQPSAKKYRNLTEEEEKFFENIENASISLDPDDSIGPPSNLIKNSDIKSFAVDTEPGNAKEGSGTDSSKIQGYHIINCDSKNVECIELRCSAEPFVDRRKFAQISVDLMLNFPILRNHLGSWQQIEFVTTGSISVTDISVELQQEPEIAQIKTVFVYMAAPSTAKWSFVVGTLIGVIFLIPAVILLKKIGFFKRKEMDEMKQQLIEEENNENQRTSYTGISN